MAAARKRRLRLSTKLNSYLISSMVHGYYSWYETVNCFFRMIINDNTARPAEQWSRYIVSPPSSPVGAGAGRHLYTRLPVLLGEDVPRAAAARPARAGAHGGGRGQLGPRLRGAHQRRQGRPGRRRRRPLRQDGGRDQTQARRGLDSCRVTSSFPDINRVGLFVWLTCVKLFSCSVSSMLVSCISDILASGLEYLVAGLLEFLTMPLSIL